VAYAEAAVRFCDVPVPLSCEASPRRLVPRPVVWYTLVHEAQMLQNKLSTVLEHTSGVRLSTSLAHRSRVTPAR